MFRLNLQKWFRSMVLKDLMKSEKSYDFSYSTKCMNHNTKNTLLLNIIVSP